MTDKKQNTIQFKRVSFNTQSPKTDHQVLQKQQLNGAIHSQFSETLGQTTETKNSLHHTNIRHSSFQAHQSTAQDT